MVDPPPGQRKDHPGQDIVDCQIPVLPDEIDAAARIAPVIDEIVQKQDFCPL
jgi:hypothetical protein